MPKLIVKHRVTDYATWRNVFDSMTELRRSHGWLATEVLRDALDPNVVTIINTVASLDQAKAYGASPDLKAAMARGGVQGPPEITFHTEAY